MTVAIGTEELAALTRRVAQLSDDDVNQFVRTLAEASTPLSDGTTPDVPPIRVLFDPDHVIDHNTIRAALIWLIAKVQDIPTPGDTTQQQSWG